MHPFPRVAIGALCLAASGSAFAEDGEYVKSYPATGKPEVRVVADDARVRVTTGDVSQVELRVTYSGYTLGRTLEIDSRKDGDVIELTEHIRSPHQLNFASALERHVNIDVRMPKTADLRVTTGDGDVRVESLSGSVFIRTGDGDVDVRQLNGEISLGSGDGDIRVDGTKGEVRLRTGDGSIEAQNLDGELQAVSGDGEINLAGRFDELDVRTGDGGVAARVAPGSEMRTSWKIQSGDGDVDITLPRSFKASFYATTQDGRIEMPEAVTVEEDQRGSKVRGVMNGGGMSFLIKTSDGRIRVEAR